MPITTPLEPIRAQIEGLLPGNHDMPDAYTQVRGGADDEDDDNAFAYMNDFHRTPVRLTAIPGGVSLAFDFDAYVKVRKRKHVLLAHPLIDGDTNRFHGTVSAVIAPTVGADWQLKPGLQNIQVDLHDAVIAHIDFPFLDLFGRNITDLMKSVLTGSLNGAADRINAQVATQADLSNRAHDAWARLCRPVALPASPQLPGLSGAIVLNPKAFGFAGISPASAQTIQTTLQLRCAPQIVVGMSPPATTTPLPALAAVPGGAHFYIQLPVSVDLTSLTESLASRVKGTKFPQVGSPQVKITDVELTAIGSHFVVRVDVDGPISARVYMAGSPHIDPSNGRITVPDLAWTAESNALLSRIALWLLQDRLDDYIRSEAHFDGTPYLNKARAMLASATNVDDAQKTVSTVFDGSGLTIAGIFAAGQSDQATLYFQASGVSRVTLK